MTDPASGMRRIRGSPASAPPELGGLSTLGLPEQLVRQMTRGAGFTRFEALSAEHP